MRKAVAATTMAAFAVLGIVSAPSAGAAPKPDHGSAGTRHATCGRAGPNLENRVEVDAPLSGAARQRSGSSTGCDAPGALQPTDDARYHCYTNADDGFTWTYLQNLRTGVRGWVRDDLLDVNPDGTSGSIEPCGF
ncbi:SH3 domain-containing protein [Umezawaea sp.]|uniref:SH3 domain-containing protein n=1 Tax=Umezawaea sp. TaxID=1955258 RepID=UPI002ED195E2